MGLLLLVVPSPAPADPPPDWRNQSMWGGLAQHSISYFQRAWDPTSGSYRSDIAFDGSVEGEARHLIALSRMAYGLAWTGHLVGDTNAIDRAKRVVQFLRDKQTGRDAHGTFFHFSVDGAGVVLTAPGHQNQANEQAYGLCGPVALYAVLPEGPEKAGLLTWIRETYAAFYRRYHDDQYGGFFDFPDHGTKSYNSTVYVATSFLLELLQADTERRADYLKTVRELADAVTDKFSDQRNFIVENFDPQWNPFWWSWQKQPEGTVGVVGHNFQAAWFLLRVADLVGVDTEEGRRYQRGAKRILERILNTTAIDRTNGGVGDTYLRETGQSHWHTNKAWWQQAEAILALTLAERRGIFLQSHVARERDAILRFYLDHFVDVRGGGEFQVVSREGVPVTTGNDSKKGSLGKSTYHVVELSLKMVQYARELAPCPAEMLPSPLLEK